MSSIHVIDYEPVLQHAQSVKKGRSLVFCPICTSSMGRTRLHAPGLHLEGRQKEMEVRLQCEHTCARSSICCRTCASTAVGSAVASLPSTRIMLLSLTFGLGGSNNPCRIKSCIVSFTHLISFHVMTYISFTMVGHAQFCMDSCGMLLFLDSMHDEISCA